MCLAIPAQVTEVLDGGRAMVESMGVTREISIRLTPEVSVGEWVLMHAGFSIEAITETDAQINLKLFEELAELSEGIV